MKRLGRTARWVIHRSWMSRAAQESRAVQDLASNYIAGGDVAEAAVEARRLRNQGLSLGFGHLGKDDDQLTTSAQLMGLVSLLGPDARGAEISVRASTLGLRTDPDEARRNLMRLCADAEAHEVFVTLDMQNADEYKATLDLYRSVVDSHPQLGVTLPVNVRRVEKDCQQLAERGRRIRLCIGSYPASADVAIQGEHEKSLALVRCLRILMESEAYPMVASHDSRIIEIAQELARRNSRTPRTWEFQMFYGVRPLEQRRLVDIGLQCRTHMPFGPAWYEYLATRIAARPRMLMNYLRALLDKR